MTVKRAPSHMGAGKIIQGSISKRLEFPGVF
jgi:hypothetical protein